jgi:hypothetical protein
MLYDPVIGYLLWRWRTKFRVGGGQNLQERKKKGWWNGDREQPWAACCSCPSSVAWPFSKKLMQHLLTWICSWRCLMQVAASWSTEAVSVCTRG